MGLAIFSFEKWQVPRDLPLSNSDVASPMGLAMFSFGKWQVPWDLPFLVLILASPMGLAIFLFRRGQVPWDLPFLDGTCHFFVGKMASPVARPISKLYRDI